MSDFIAIQGNIFCENCKDCGARPVVEQVKGNFVVRCPDDKKHYRTEPGLFDTSLQDWNLKNRANVPVVSIQTQKAS
jgi:hypothetical protein